MNITRVTIQRKSRNTKISQAEFLKAMTDPMIEKRPRGRGVHLNMTFEYSKERNCTMVNWTCPVCETPNKQVWFGRDYHICIKCEQPTELK